MKYRVVTFAALTLLLCLLLSSCFVSCQSAPENGVTGNVDYSDLAANSYEVEEVTNTGYKLYRPVADGVEYALIFFLGTAMSVDNYDYIMTKTAAAGVAVYVPSNPFPDLTYNTIAIDYNAIGAEYYLVGGHSQGGGAAVRYAAENADTIKGLILFSPLVSNDATLVGIDIPSLYFQAENDYVLTDAMQADAKSRMNDACKYVLLNGAGHMCYGESSLLDNGGTVRPKQEIQDGILHEIVSFLDAAING